MDETQTRRSPPVRAPGSEVANNSRCTAGSHESTAAVVQLPTLEPAANRRRPPFGAEIEQALAAGQWINLFIFVGDGAWDRAGVRRFQHGQASATLLPEGTAPEAVEWPRVDAATLVGEGIDRAAALRVAQAVVSAGVRCVVAPQWSFMVRSRPPRGAV
jgi:hypothetical protein